MPQLNGADTEAAEVVGVYEHTAQSNDHYQKCLPAGSALCDRVMDFIDDASVDEPIDIRCIAN